MFYIYTDFDYTAVANDLNSLTKSQEELIQFMKNFDEEMEVRREEKEAEKEQNSEDKTFEMKFLGISFSSVSWTTKFIYSLMFLALFAGIIYYGFSRLDESQKFKTSSKRRSPKKRE